MENTLFLCLLSLGVGIVIGYSINFIISVLNIEKQRKILSKRFNDAHVRLEFISSPSEYIDEVIHRYGVPITEDCEVSFFGIEWDEVETHESYLENLEEYKKFVDRSPNKFLRFHLNDALAKERYELAEYIKQTAKNRNFKL